MEEDCGKGFVSLAVYSTLAGYKAGASLKANLGNHGHFMFSTSVPHLVVIPCDVKSCLHVL